MSNVLEVIYLIGRGWTVREAGTGKIIDDSLDNQKDAISVAQAEAEFRVDVLGVRTVEVRIKTKWLKRIRDARTYGRDDPAVKG
jgi:hypothetical protein